VDHPLVFVRSIEVDEPERFGAGTAVPAYFGSSRSLTPARKTPDQNGPELLDSSLLLSPLARRKTEITRDNGPSPVIPIEVDHFRPAVPHAGRPLKSRIRRESLRIAAA